MPTKRVYDDGCGIAHAMNLIGERWSVLIVRELLLGPKRFSDLLADLPGVGSNALAQRLQHLEAVGVLRRSTLPPPAGSRVYELTEWGAGLAPALAALSQWGSASPVVRPAGEVGADSLMLGLRTAFESRPQPRWTGTYGIALGDKHFTVEVARGQLTTYRGQPHRADVNVRTDVRTFKAVLENKRPVKEAIRAGHLVLTGDRQAFDRLLACVTTSGSAARVHAKR